MNARQKAEQRELGRAMLDRTAAESLNGDFYFEGHRIIAEAIRGLLAEGREPDMSSVYAALASHPKAHLVAALDPDSRPDLYLNGCLVAYTDRLGTETDPDSVAGTVAGALGGLAASPSRDEVLAALCDLAEVVRGRDQVFRTTCRGEATDMLKALGFPPGEARDLVAAALRFEEQKPTPGPDVFADVEPWADQVNGAVLLGEVEDAITRYVVVAKHAAVAVALWVVMTYCMDWVPVAVRLILTSPTKACGKTRLFTLLAALVRRAMPNSSITPSVLFRIIEAHRPTILIDEADNAGLPDNDDLRAVVNSGHTRGAAYVWRSVGDEHTPGKFSTWAAVALAGIGKLPDTVTSRAVVVRMERKSRKDTVDKLRETRLVAELEPLRRKLARWAADHGPVLVDADPELPPELDGRPADNWGALVAIADAAGGDWPSRARKAALAFEGDAETDDAGEMLLADLRDLFGGDRDRLTSEEIVTALGQMLGRPWPEYGGKPITPRGVAKLLKRFGIEPRTIRLAEGRTPKGYHRDQFEEAFARYMPPNPPQAPQAANGAGKAMILDPQPDPSVSDRKDASDPHESGAVADVADSEPFPEAEGPFTSEQVAGEAGGDHAA